MLYYGEHLLLFCSDPAEAQKVINKVATEKGVPYIPTESNVLHYGPGVGVFIQGRVLIRVWVFIQGKKVYHECSHKPQGDLLFCKASRGCCIWPCGWELISRRAPIRTRAFI